MSKKPGSGKAKPSSASADQSQPIYTKSHDDQVDLLAQALLREYMHKKGYKESLAAFDAESPRDENTVSSRKVMGDLMLLSSDKQKAIKDQGLETVMEMLCYDRVTKKGQLAQMSSLQSVLGTELPPLFAAPPIAPKEKKTKKDKATKKDKSSADEGTVDKKSKKEKKIKKEKKGAKSTSSDGLYAGMDDLIDKEVPAVEHVSLKKKPPTDGPKKRVTIITDDDKLPKQSEAQDEEALAKAANKVYGDASSSSSSSDDGGDANSDDDNNKDSDSADDSDEDFNAALRRIKHQEEADKKAKHSELKSDGSRKEANWSVDSKSGKATAGPSNPTTQLHTSAASSAVAHRPPAPHVSPLGQSVAAAIMTALVGGGSQSSYRKVPNSFMRHGFHFTSEGDGEDVRYGLLQNEGGPSLWCVGCHPGPTAGTIYQ